jgi:multidrug resistance efflux pump
MLAAGSYWLQGQSRPPVRAPRPVHTTDSRSIFAPGVVEGAGRQIDLRLEVAGRVAQVAVKEGDFVDEGALLVQLDDATQRHQLAILKAELAGAEAQLQRLENGAHPQEREEAKALLAAREARLKHAELERDRAQRLVEHSAGAAQELARWQAEVNALQAEVLAAKAHLELLLAPPRDDELAAAKARVDAARARVELAETELRRTRLLAPVAGEVLAVHCEVGERIDLTDPQPVVVLADTRRRRVRAFVEELDAVRVRLKMPAKVTADGLPGKVFHGQVVEIMPRMTFKQVWSDRPGERYDAKTREVVVELAEPGVPTSLALQNASEEGDLVYGLLVEVELLPTPLAPDRQAARVLP